MKCFIFIDSYVSFQRFFETEAFSGVEERYDVLYVFVKTRKFNKTAVRNSIGSDKNITWIKYDEARFEMWQELFNISCFLNKDLSESFAIRSQESFKINPKKMDRVNIYSNYESYTKYRNDMETKMGLKPDIIKLLLVHRPDFFILPSSLLDYITDDVLQISNYFNIPTLLLVAGWDNLSSKGLLYHKPSLVGVWGEQSKRHAISIQRMLPERVRIIGAPHYDFFLNNDAFDPTDFRDKLKIPPSIKVILFAGTFRLFDETQLLKIIDDAIESGELPPLHIIYRPHPYRLRREIEEDFFSISWKHITFDPQSLELYTKKTSFLDKIKDFRKAPFYEFDYLKKLYLSVDMTISPMSSVLLESMIFGRPILAIAFSDNKHSWSADKVSRMHHFNELYDNGDVLICQDVTKFLEFIKKLYYYSEDKDLCQRLIKFSNYFVQLGDGKYGQKLLNELDLLHHIDSHKPIYFDTNSCGSISFFKNPKTFLLIKILLISYYKKYLFSILSIPRRFNDLIEKGGKFFRRYIGIS